MNVNISYFGQLGAIAGIPAEDRELAAGTDVATLLRAVASQYGDGAKRIMLDEAGCMRPSLIVVVNGAVIDRSNPPRLEDGDVLSLIAAIAGG